MKSHTIKTSVMLVHVCHDFQQCHSCSAISTMYAIMLRVTINRIGFPPRHPSQWCRSMNKLSNLTFQDAPYAKHRPMWLPCTRRQFRFQIVPMAGSHSGLATLLPCTPEPELKVADNRWVLRDPVWKTSGPHHLSNAMVPEAAVIISPTNSASGWQQSKTITNSEFRRARRSNRAACALACHDVRYAKSLCNKMSVAPVNDIHSQCFVTIASPFRLLLAFSLAYCKRILWSIYCLPTAILMVLQGPKICTQTFYVLIYTMQELYEDVGLFCLAFSSVFEKGRLLFIHLLHRLLFLWWISHESVRLQEFGRNAWQELVIIINEWVMRSSSALSHR